MSSPCSSPAKRGLVRPMDPAALLSSRARSSQSSIIRDLLRLVDRPDMLSLAGGLPAPELLPTERVAEAAARVLGTAGRRALQYGPTEGMSELRSVVAQRLDSPIESVVITTGSQQAVDLVARTLVDAGDVVVVENPSYLGSLQSLRANGARAHRGARRRRRHVRRRCWRRCSRTASDRKSSRS